MKLPEEEKEKGKGGEKGEKNRRGFPFRIVPSGYGFLPFPFFQGFSFYLPLFALHSAEHMLVSQFWEGE